LEWAQEFAKVNDEFIRYLTRLEHPEKADEELLTRWLDTGGMLGFLRSYKEHNYTVFAEENHGGWVVSRATADAWQDWQVLADNIAELPLVFSSFPSSARLVERFFPEPPPSLNWITRDR
jgi:hypothetical protein